MDFPPSKDEPYNLKYETEEILRASLLWMLSFLLFSKPDVLSMDVDNLVFKGQVKDGFFIEAGGHNFEFESTSLYFELRYNWTGLLVEPNKLYYQDGLKKKRKIYSTNSCLGMKPRPDILRYSIFDESTIENRGDVDMQCFPLYSLILAAGNPTVNYMSLDIEGGEFQVLLTLPWDKVDIEVMTLESHFMGEKTPGTLQDVIGYLAEKGYKHIPGAHKSKTFGLGAKVKLAQKDGANDAERIEIKRGAVNSHCSGKEMILTNDLFVRNDVALKYGL